jgi:uncharacterized protein
MPFIAAIGTYLPCWGCDVRRIVGDDEDAITLTVEAGRAAVDVDPAGAAAIVTGDPLPTQGASAGLFALAQLAESGPTGPLVAVEQANLSGIAIAGAPARVYLREPQAQTMPATTFASHADTPTSLAAYERALEAKTRWEAGEFADSDQLDFPPRYRVADDASLATHDELVALPRVGTVYTSVAVHLRAPGLRTPNALAVVELDDVDLRAPVTVTGADPDSVDIGDRGRLVLRRVAVRSGVPDYGYAFQPELEAGAA